MRGRILGMVDGQQRSPCRIREPTTMDTFSANRKPAASWETSLWQTDALHEGSIARVGVKVVESLVHRKK